MPRSTTPSSAASGRSGVVEVGAGHSTKLASRAIRENGAGRILCIDPHAPQWLGALEGEIEVVAKPVQETPDSVFLGLEPSDILFIDGSHISKTGSDVNHLFLRILPRLPRGVVVHIHDICLPFEYPKAWSEDVLCYWNEQYVLAALLANSREVRDPPRRLLPPEDGHRGAAAVRAVRPRGLSRRRQPVDADPGVRG